MRRDLIGLLTVCLVLVSPVGGKSVVQQGLLGWCAGEQESTKPPFLETSVGLPLPHLHPMNLSWGLREVRRNHPPHMNVLLTESHTALYLGTLFSQVLGEATKGAREGEEKGTGSGESAESHSQSSVKFSLCPCSLDALRSRSGFKVRSR